MPTISSYRCPVAKTSSAYLLGWLREARNEAQLYLENQPGFTELEEDRKIADRHFPDMFRGFMAGGISGAGMTNPGIGGGDQRIHVPEVKRMLSEMCAILGNIEPSWSHHPSNEELRDVSEVLDKCTRAWWERTQAVEQIVSCLQWSAVNRSGYLFPVWNPHFRGIGQGDIQLRVGGPEDYLPLWPDDSHDIQQAYAGTIKVRMPITQFAATWPTLAASVYPDDVQPNSLAGKVIEGAKALWRGDTKDESKPGRVPQVTVYWTYIRDMSLNVTGNIIPMGVKGTNTYYDVPAFGSDIPTGLVNLNTGSDLTRKAEQKDTYLYPWLRLVIWTEHVVCYDGPSYWFHGKIPAVKLTLDPWPWSFLGGSLVRDIASIEAANNRTLKSIDKRERLKADPARAVNEDLLDNTTIEAIRAEVNTPGGLLKVDRFAEGLLKPLHDPRDNQVDQWELEYYRGNRDSMMDVLGLNNLQRLAELRQMPGGDTQEKMLQITGARTQRKGNLMEKFCAELAPMIDGLIFQWYDSPFRWRLFGYKGITKYDFDHDPKSLVPSEIPGRPNQTNGDRKFGDPRSGLFDTRAKRAKYLITTMGIQIERGSLLDITSMTRQLMEMRLWSDPTFPKDPVTLGESLRLSNMGTMDDSEDMDTRIGRAKKWAKISTEAIAELQLKQQEILRGGTPEGQMGDAIRKIVQSATGNGGGNGGEPIGGNRPPGRPPVFSEPPQLRTMNRPDGTQDTVIDTSSNR
jgi:hypothetical protein